MIVWRLVGVLAVVVGLAAAFTPLPNALGGAMAVAPREERADAIVVLGSGQYPDDELTDSSLRRAVHGLVLWRRGLAPVIVFTGAPGPARVSEARVRERLATAFGVPGSALLLVESARTTREEAMAAAAVLRPRGARRILLVTSALHLARAGRVFARVGLEPLPAPSLDVSFAGEMPGDRLRLLWKVVDEAAARVYYRVAGFD